MLTSAEPKKKWYDFVFKMQPQWVLALSLLFSFIFLALVALAASRRSVKAISNIEDAAARVGQNMAGPTVSAGEARVSAEAESTSDDRSDFKAYLSELQTESLLEMLAECYWTHNDSFAAGLWNAMSATQRQEVAKQIAWAEEHAEHLLTVKPQFYSRFYSPYYLKPLKMHSLDQKTISETMELVLYLCSNRCT